MEFGLPKSRQQKTEKYTNEGVLTFMPTGPGMGRKMELNTKALELLNISDSSNQISFSFSGADIYIVNTSGTENCSGLKVGKTSNGFADKKHYEFIKTKTYNLKEEDTLELFLEETSNEFNGNKVYKLVNILSTITQEKDQLLELHSDEQKDWHDQGTTSDLYTNTSEYTQEQLDMLESDNYAKELDVTSPEQLYNTITE